MPGAKPDLGSKENSYMLGEDGKVQRQLGVSALSLPGLLGSHVPLGITKARPCEKRNYPEAQTRRALGH